MLHANRACGSTRRKPRGDWREQGGSENPKAKRHRANHFFLHVGNSTVSSSLRRNLDVFPVAVDQSLHWSSCASVDRLIPSKHPLVDHFMHMANGAMPTSKATENDWCVSAIWRNCNDSGLTVLCTNSDVNTGGFWSHFKDRRKQPQRQTTLKHIYK